MRRSTQRNERVQSEAVDDFRLDPTYSVRSAAMWAYRPPATDSLFPAAG
jgi:hypothetical protein